jgi:hypothetical protein
MKIRNRFLAAALATTALLVSSAQAQAATALISGLVLWGAGTPTTEYSKAGEATAFSFDLPDVGSNPTSDITNFSYSLNGTAVAATPTQIAFFTAGAAGGMFDIDFTNDVVSIYGADIGSSGTIGPAGGYPVTAALNDALINTGTGFGLVTVTLSGVPEPATWAVMFAGFGGIGVAMRTRRKRAIAA